MIRAKCVVSRVQLCQLTPVLAARQAFDQGTGRPSNEDSPPLLPWYLHYFCGVIKNPVPGVGQRIRQPLSLRRPCFLFAILNVNESFSPLFIFFLFHIFCVLVCSCTVACESIPTFIEVFYEYIMCVI